MMAYPMDCNACIGGDHENHDATEGTRLGLIGGSICECIGDCAERFEARCAELRTIFADAVREAAS